MFEEFSILSGHLFYKRARRDGDDWLIEVKDRPEDKKGTFITLKINTDATWTIREVFELYQGDDVYFRKTHVPVLVGRYPPSPFHPSCPWRPQPGPYPVLLAWDRGPASPPSLYR
jgi:hypothetical protein